MSKILFITANRLGDAVLASGVLAHLVAQYPGAQFTIICGPYASGLFRAVPGIERLIVLRKKPWNAHWLEAWRACADTRWDLIVDLRDSIISRILRATQRVRRGPATGHHKVIEFAQVLGLAGAPPAPHIWLDAQAEREAAQIIPDGAKILALGPGANWACKQWPPERFAALAQKLIGTKELDGASVLIIALNEERAALAPLLEKIPIAKRVELFSRDLLTVAACLKRARLFVGNDSGLMHMAAAMGTPTLGLFGPGQEEIYGPWGETCAVVRTLESRVELLTRIAHPRDNFPNLMEGLSVEKAYEAAMALLASSQN